MATGLSPFWTVAAATRGAVCTPGLTSPAERSTYGFCGERRPEAARRATAQATYRGRHLEGIEGCRRGAETWWTMDGRPGSWRCPPGFPGPGSCGAPRGGSDASSAYENWCGSQIAVPRADGGPRCRDTPGRCDRPTL